MITFCLLAFTLIGCGDNEINLGDILNVEDYSWQMTMVQSMKSEGQPIAYGLNNDGTLESAMKILLTCTTTDGTITISDETNGQTYFGTYTLTETNQQTSTYKITIGETVGMAVVSMTTYRDGDKMPTFVISLEDYTINFFPATE